MNSRRIGSIACAGLLLGVLSAGTALAETQWEKDHPRRDEVNDRLENQHRRIEEGVKDGQLTPGEAHHLRREDRKIRREERRYARRHHGHISKREQKRLNREENKASRDIYRERHD